MLEDSIDKLRPTSSMDWAVSELNDHLTELLRFVTLIAQYVDDFPMGYDNYGKHDGIGNSIDSRQSSLIQWNCIYQIAVRLMLDSRRQCLPTTSITIPCQTSAPSRRNADSVSSF